MVCVIVESFVELVKAVAKSIPIRIKSTIFVEKRSPLRRKDPTFPLLKDC